ncbi:MAG: hypothetical protein NT031_13845, partial [Planctomycetota bacterium]|nr:hypothetical protein [Planctomycetota bacterium]
LLVGALLIVRRWRGRRVACGCLLVLCLASLVVQALALSSIREVWQISVHMSMLGVGAWLAAAGALGGGFFAGLAAATAEPRG